MYIIKKPIPKIEDGKLLHVGYVRIKKCRNIQDVNEFMASVFPHHGNYLVTEYTHDPDRYPAISKWVKNTSGEDWLQ